jgi:hypothetical protein
MSRRIDHQRAGRRDRPPLSGGLFLAPCTSAKTQTNHKKTAGYGSRFHIPASPILEGYSFPCLSVLL